MTRQPSLDAITTGSGPHGILLIHGSGSGARPLAGLAEELVDAVPESKAVAVNLPGYGKPAVDLSRSVLQQHLDHLGAAVSEGTWHVVAHSMGGFLALQLARQLPEHVASLSLIEPVALGVLDPDTDREALELDRTVIEDFQTGQHDDTGIARFIETWNQTAWNRLPEPVRQRLTSMAPCILAEAIEVSNDRTPLAAYSVLSQPILVLAGRETLLPAKRIAERLSTLPAVAALRWIDHAGHMDVLRMPGPYAAEISAHLRRVIETPGSNR